MQQCTTTPLWSTVYWSSPYGLDQYALQALRPEVQNKKKSKTKRNQRISWAVRPKICFCWPYGQQKKKNKSTWFHFEEVESGPAGQSKLHGRVKIVIFHCEITVSLIDHQCTTINAPEIKWNMLRYKLLLLKIAIAFSVVWVNSTCFILLYGGDVFVFHMLASQIAISHKENTHMGRLYIFVLGGITFVLFNVRLCGIIFAFSHLLAYCLLCGDMSVNPLLLITHCQDENRQLISFWNEYSWRSVLGGVCCWLFYNKPWFVILFYFIFFCCVAAEHNN